MGIRKPTSSAGRRRLLFLALLGAHLIIICRSLSEKEALGSPLRSYRHHSPCPFYHDIPAFFGMSMKELLDRRTLIADGKPKSWSIPELKKATDLFVRKESPSWDFDEAAGCWKWVKSPPARRKSIAALDPAERKSVRKAMKARGNKILKEFGCQICRKVMSFPVTIPCAHNFCKECLTSKFSGITQVRERSRSGRTLRTQKYVMNCPCCPTDISDFLQNPQVNRELMDVIEEVKKKEEDQEAQENSENVSEEVNTESEEEEEEEEEEETQIHVSEDEPATKKIKLSA